MSCAFRNKYAEVELSIWDENLIVSKKESYQMHGCFINKFNLPNLQFVVSLALS